VAEQRALEEVVVEGRAVLDHERLLGPRAVGVDGPGHQLLAGAALAVDQHGRLALHDLLEQAQHLAHGRARADDLVERVAGGGRLGADEARRGPHALGGHGRDQIAQVLELGLGQARQLGDRARAVALDVSELADLAQELSGRHRGQRVADAAAGEHEPSQLVAEPQRRGDHVEAEVTAMDVGPRRLARAAGPPGAQVVGHHPHALVAAAEALLREQRQLAQLVLRREDLAVGVIEHVALGIGEGQLEAPPPAQQIAHDRHRGEVQEAAQIDHGLSL
jgi:hypothetical protein